MVSSRMPHIRGFGDTAGARVNPLVDALFGTTGRTQTIHLLCDKQDGKSYRNIQHDGDNGSSRIWLKNALLRECRGAGCAG